MAKPVKVVVLGDASDAKRAFREIQAEADATGSKMQRVGQQLSSAGSTLTRGVTLPLVGAAGAALHLAGVQEEAEAKLASTFESMGAAAWTNTEALQANASALQEVSTFGDEAIIGMQSVLLTFGNVTDQIGEGNDIFSQATEIGLDMSAALGQDLQSSAIQLGKALNDPVAGITALSRVGVSFTEQQKEQIRTLAESGDTLGAQKIILQELENQFGGTAEAIANTDSGKMKQAMNSLGDAAESFGAIIAPVAAKVAGFFKTLAERFQALSPAQQEMIVKLAAVAAAVGPVLIVAGKAISMFRSVGVAFKALSAILSANPWLLLIAATVALVTLIVKNWDDITAFLREKWDWVMDKATAVGDWISDKWDAAVSFVTDLIKNWTIVGLLATHWDDIKNAVTEVKDWIEDKWNAVLDFFGTVPGKIGDLASGMWDGITDAFRAAINTIIRGWNNLEFSIPGFNFGPINFDGFTLGVPDIPTLHTGGTFRAPTPGGAGLAMLLDGERIERFGGRGTEPTIVVNVAGSVISERDLVEAVRDGLIRTQRRSGLGLALQ